MSMTPWFKARLEKAIRIVKQELRDGCVDCLALPHGTYCKIHEREALDISLNPRGSAAVQALLRSESKPKAE